MRLPQFIQNIYLRPTRTNRILVMVAFVVVLVVIPLWTGLVDQAGMEACGLSWSCLLTDFDFYLLISLMLASVLGAYFSIELIKAKTLQQDDQDQT